MAEKVIENNKVSVIGEIISEFSFSHEVFGEGFYMAELSVNRLSEQADVIPLMVSERLIDVHRDLRGSTIEAIGQFRSYNRHEGVKNRLMLSVFAREIRFLEEFTDYTRTNQIFLDGYICQAANLPQDAPGQRDCGSFAGSEPALRQIRLHTLHQLGEKCPLCIRLYRGGARPHLGKGSKPGVHEETQRNRVRKKSGL